MSTVEVREVRDDGTVLVRVPAQTCPVCDQRLALRPQVAVRSTSCPDHPTSTLLSHPDVPGIEVLIRQVTGDRSAGAQPAIRQIKSMLDRRWGTIADALTAMANPIPWGLDLDLPAREVEADVAATFLWAMTGVTAAQRHQWGDLAITDISTVNAWTVELGEAAADWYALGLRRDQASRWRRAGFTPQTLPAGFTDPDAYAFVKVADLPVDPQWGALVHHVSVDFAVRGHREGADPDDIRALGAWAVAHYTGNDTWAHPGGAARTVEKISFQERWTAKQQNVVDNAMNRFRGLNWAHVALALDAGLTPKETVTYLRGDRDIEALRVMAGMSGK